MRGPSAASLFCGVARPRPSLWLCSLQPPSMELHKTPSLSMFGVHGFPRNVLCILVSMSEQGHCVTRNYFVSFLIQCHWILKSSNQSATSTVSPKDTPVDPATPFHAAQAYEVPSYFSSDWLNAYYDAQAASHNHEGSADRPRGTSTADYRYAP